MEVFNQISRRSQIKEISNFQGFLAYNYQGVIRDVLTVFEGISFTVMTFALTKVKQRFLGHTVINVI